MNPQPTFRNIGTLRRVRLLNRLVAHALDHGPKAAYDHYCRFLMDATKALREEGLRTS